MKTIQRFGSNCTALNKPGILYQSDVDCYACNVKLAKPWKREERQRVLFETVGDLWEFTRKLYAVSDLFQDSRLPFFCVIYMDSQMYFCVSNLKLRIYVIGPLYAHELISEHLDISRCIMHQVRHNKRYIVEVHHLGRYYPI
jgi:hypothetical protein